MSVDQLCRLSVCMWAWFLFKAPPWACSYKSVCVRYIMAKSTGCAQMTDWSTQLACELRQKHSADRAAGWTTLAMGQSNVHTQPGLRVRSGLISPVHQATQHPDSCPGQISTSPSLKSPTNETHTCQAQPEARMQRKLISFCSFHEWLGNTF